MEALRLGAADYVVKEPGNTFLDLLENSIRKVLERGRLIKEKKRAEEELQKAHDELEKRVEERTRELQKLTSAIEQSPVMIFITDPNGVIEYVNPSFTEMTGYSPEEAVGQNPRILKSEGTPPEKIKDLWETITSGRQWRSEIKNKRKDGEYFWSAVSISPIKSENGDITHFVAMHENITEHKKSQEKLKLAKEQAEIANRAKSELLANTSHELRTPLNAIIGFSNSLRNETFGALANDKQREYVNDIFSSGEHLLELINDILDVAAVEGGRLELHDENLVVSDLAEAVMRMVSSRAKAGNLKLSCDIKEDSPHLLADPRRVKQIILNLLSNAVKFTEEGGEVAFKAQLSDDGSLSLIISDTGIGMDELGIAKAMTQFGQVDSKLARKYEGTGLGLPLTEGLLELHGGSLKVESALGKGTTVTAQFPKERVIE